MATDNKGKITKGKKMPVKHFGVSATDNTAPVIKILKDFELDNSQAYMLYGQTLMQREKRELTGINFHFTLTGHPLNAFTENWDGDLPSGFFEGFTYKSLNPKMMTNMRNIDKCDPVADYIKIKMDWNRVIKRCRKAVYPRMIQNYEILNEDVMHCPKHFVDLAVQLDSDPDPYFAATYNWHYAGHGNLQLICIDWVDYLLHSEFDTLYLSQFSKNDMTVSNVDQATFKCEGNNILETICSSQNIIALRTKHKVYILKIESGEILKFDKIKATESELPFTSISFDNYHKNILYITSLDLKLTIVNLDRLTGRRVQLKCRLSSLVDNWNSVISSDRVTYTHVARNSLTFYDKRTNRASHTWDDLRNLTDDSRCNDISVAKQCEGSHSLYFGTDHHLFLMDARCPHIVKPKAVQRWTHGMKCLPTYMTICHFEYNKEIICLSSQWCEDMCVVTNYLERSNDTEISGVMVPYRPPSILNAIEEAQQKLLCSDLYNPVRTRLCTAITGNIIMEQEENYVILLQNSLGDISYHTLYPEHMEPFVINDSLDHLHEWSKAFKVKKEPFEVSSIENFVPIWQRLKKIPQSHRFGEGKLLGDLPCKYNEKEIAEAFKSEELDNALLDVWMGNSDDTIMDCSTRLDQSSIHLNYSDSE